MLRVARFRLQYVVLRGQLSDVNQITLLRRLPARLLSVIFLSVISVRLINVFLLGRSPMEPPFPRRSRGVNVARAAFCRYTRSFAHTPAPYGPMRNSPCW
jgi:hypothetical protein